MGMVEGEVRGGWGEGEGMVVVEGEVGLGMGMVLGMQQGMPMGVEVGTEQEIQDPT